MSKGKSLDYQLYVQREMEFMHSPYKHELDFYEHIKNGRADKIMENKALYANVPEADDGKGKLSDSPLRNQLYHMIVNTAIITRICINEGLSAETAYTLSDMYIRDADKCKTINQIKELNDKMVMDFTEQMRLMKNGKSYSHTIKSVVNYICDNLNMKISVNALSYRFGYNRSYFSILFKKETGYTVSDFIMKKRIETAANMLLLTDFSYSDISLSLGFSSQSHFCKCFKENMGTTPKAYRLENKV